ncbi:N-6 DNA methylase [Marinicrinis sediminis]|uniref:site-specific DNA-methyltransferase (adenine-specific) n=1 Tax=Marinicrinis sediminis TaxID=1652465 RepID=A0ABW5R8L9_9BACL
MYDYDKIEIFKHRLSRILDIVRSDISVRNYDLDLYVLSLVFLKRVADNTPHIQRLWKHIRNNATHLRESRIVASELDKTFSELDEYLGKYNNLFHGIKFENCNFMTSIYAIIAYLDSLSLSSDEISDHDMGVAFEYLIQRLRFYSLGVRPYPDEIKKLLVNLLDVKQNERVYDPFCGTGGFLTEIITNAREYSVESKRISIFGQEKDSKNHSICIMNFIMHGEYDVNIFFGDTLLHPGNIHDNQITQFDKIITRIPFSVRSDNYYSEYVHDRYGRFQYGLAPRKSSDYAFIQHIISSLKQNGRAIVVVDDRLLASEGNEREIRRRIIENDLIEAVVSIPMKVSSFSKKSFSLLVLKKNKESYKTGKVLFINGLWYSDFDGKRHMSNVSLDTVAEILKKYDEVEGTSRVVSLIEIQENNFSLNVNRYDSIFIENEVLLKKGIGKKLRDVFEIVSDVFIRQTEEDEHGLPYVRIRDLNESIKEKYINTNEIERRRMLINKEVLSKQAIIISLLGEKLKPTIYDTEHSPTKEIIIGQNLLALVPRVRLINIEYLYYQLYSPRVLNQIAKLRAGTIPRIKKNDFLNIVINVPDLKSQEEYIKEQKLSLIEIESLRDFSIEKENELERTAQDAQKEIISTLSHNALPYIFYIHSNISILRKFLYSKGMLDEFVENPIQNTKDIDIELLIASESSLVRDSIRGIFDRLEVYTKTLEEYIDRTNKIIKLDLKKSDFKIVNLCDFLNELVDIHRREIKDKYQISVDCLKNIYLNMHEVSFRELFNQLFRNAEMHAFDMKNNKKNKNTIRIKVTENGDFLNIIYTNNGRPFDLSKNDYISPLKKGRESNGQGLGGAYINKVIGAHSGRLEINQRDSGMELHFILPLKENL